MFGFKGLICVHPEAKTLVYRYMFLQVERLPDVKQRESAAYIHCLNKEEDCRQQQ